MNFDFVNNYTTKDSFEFVYFRRNSILPHKSSSFQHFSVPN